MSRNIVIRTSSSPGASTNAPFEISGIPSLASPADVSLTLSATPLTTGARPGTLVGTLNTTDPNVGQEFTYSIQSGPNSRLFTVVGNELRTVGPIAQPGTYLLNVQTQDTLGFTFTQLLQFGVQPSTTPPTSIGLSYSTLIAGQSAGTTIGVLSTNEPNYGAIDTFTLTGPNASRFQIAPDGKTLQSAVVFENTEPATINLGVRVTNSLGQTLDSSVAITINPSTTPPSDIPLDNTEEPSGWIVDTFDTSDPNAGHEFTYSLAASADGGDFGISGNQLKAAVTFSKLTRTAYNRQVASTDTHGLSFAKNLSIMVNPLPQAPTSVTLTSTSTSASYSPGSLVGTFSAADANSDNTFTYTLLTGTQNFALVGNHLNRVDVSGASSFDIEVQVTDAAGLTFDKQFTISVAPTDTLPPDVTLTNSTNDNGLTVGSVIGTLVPVKPDRELSFSAMIVPTNDPTTGKLTTQLLTIDPTQNVLRTNTVIRVKGTSQIPVDIRTTDILGVSSDQIVIITINQTAARAAAATQSSVTTANAPIDSDVANAVLASGAPSGVVTSPVGEGGYVGIASTPSAAPFSAASTAQAVTPPAPEISGKGVAAAPEPELPPFDPSLYMVSVTTDMNDVAFEAASISSISMVGSSPVPELHPTDRMFSNMAQRHQEVQVDAVDLALWAVKAPEDQVAIVRAAVDDQVFATDEPGTGAWGLSVLGGVHALRVWSNEPEEAELAEVEEVEEEPEE